MVDRKRLEKIASHVAMSRGTLVIDENVSHLGPLLRTKNIHVITPPSGMSDDDIMNLILPNRIIVTRNPKDFEDYASSGDFGIISLTSLKFVDSATDPNQNKTVQLISKACKDLSLWSKRHGFIVTLYDDGTYDYEDLID